MVTYDLEIKLKSGELLIYKGVEEECFNHSSGCSWVRIYHSGKLDGVYLMDDYTQIALAEILWLRTTRNPRYDKE